MISILGTAKRSLDSTVDSYLGRLAFAACILGAGGFALAGLWVFLSERYDTIVASFSLAGLLAIAALIIHFSILAAEKRANRDIAVVEKTLEKNVFPVTNALPFDLPTALTVLPIVLPLLRSLRPLLPIVLVAGLAVGYLVLTSPKDNSDKTASA
ncbi:hypothetical protein DLM45_06645 [Hyphomicrobium methylovorum]|uniref:hypothetical protein n=1 Tax=Hyphomicrobium methylovorum TaxID=84 RepID=UPI0015E7148A|nr:hypothetical protein [Hyphomicrobium methylovorum]MBA2125901.1 hypothetical protein [Hyphomicrobium methylovorum]